MFVVGVKYTVPQQACAWATQQQWEPEPGSIPPLVWRECKPWEHGTGPAACDESTQQTRRVFRPPECHDHQSQPITACLTAHPCPPRDTNISWKGNCRWRSFSITSTHLGSPGWLSSSWSNTFRRHEIIAQHDMVNILLFWIILKSWMNVKKRTHYCRPSPM